MPIGPAALVLAALTAGTPPSTVTAHLTSEGRAPATYARMVAADVLRRAGVTLRWTGAGATLHVHLAERAPNDLPLGALALAYPYSGCAKAVTIYADRVRQLTGGRFGEEAAMLGYVIAHELVHVLQGVDRHSETGIMKARWTMQDRAAILSRALGFDEEDTPLIRRGLALGPCRAPSVSTTRSVARTAARPATR